MPAADDKAQSWRDLSICFWLANFSFIGGWDDLLQLSSKTVNYYRLAPPDTGLLIPVLLDVALLTILLWFCARLVRRLALPWLTTIAQCAFLMALMAPSRHIVNWWVKPHIDELTALIIQRSIDALIVAGIVMLVFFRLRIALLIGRGIALVVVPLIAVNLFCIFLLWRPSPESFASRQPAARVTALNTTRMVWIIFDEMDQRLVFPERPPAIELPELDRLRSEAIYATNVRSPDYWTRSSIPALLTGNHVQSTFPTAPNDLTLTFDDGTRRPWSTQQTVFSRVRAFGVNSGLTGWFHPYCRVIGDQLTSCFWEPHRHAITSLTHYRYARSLGIASGMAAQVLLYLDRLPLIRRLNFIDHLRRAELPIMREEQVAEYQRLISESVRMAADPLLGLVVIHLPIPHPVGIYSRFTNSISAGDGANYLDNLELADRSLGRLRRAIERAGLWDKTALLVTSDHPFRGDLWKDELVNWSREEAELTGNRNGELVPFVLKLPGQTKNVTYTAPFNNMLTHDLALALLSNKVAGVEQTISWIDAHRAQTIISSNGKPDQNGSAVANHR